ncbi:hypothetical protein R6Q59_006092 [Mikania micrantha]
MEVSIDALSDDYTFVEAWKKVAPDMDPPKTPIQFLLELSKAEAFSVNAIGDLNGNHMMRKLEKYCLNRCSEFEELSFGIASILVFGDIRV